MAYYVLPFPVTLKVICLLQSISNMILFVYTCAAVDKMSTDIVHCIFPL